MAGINNLKTSFNIESKLEPIYTGGTIQLTTDGDYLFCLCGSEIKVVNVVTGKVQTSIQNAEDAILNFTLSPNDKALVTFSQSGLLKHIEWPSNKTQKIWKSTHKGPISCMIFDPTTTLIATGGSDSAIIVWDIIQQFCTHNLKGSSGVITTLEFHPDISKLMLFGASGDYHIRGWNLSTSQICCTLEGHFSTVTSITFTSSGKEMISSGRDKVVIIWDLLKYVSLRTIPVFETVESAFILPATMPFPDLGVHSHTANYFITAGDKGILRLWSFNGQLIHTQKEAVPADQDGTTICRGFLNIETLRICLITNEHNIIFYHLENFALEKQLIGFNDDILDLSYFGKNEIYLAVATNSANIKIFNNETGSSKLVKGHSDIVLSLDCFPTAPNILVSCSKDNTVHLWRINDDSDICCVAVGTGHTHSVGSVAASRLSAKFLVSGSQDKCLKLWDIPHNVIVDEFKFTLPLTLNVKWTVIGHQKDINSLCISPNDRLVASASQDKTIKIWSTSDGRCIADLRGHRRSVWCVQFSPVDQVVASGSADGLIKLWSLTDFSCVMTFEGHECSVLRVAFFNKGMQLLSSASDGLVKLWTVKNNECIKTLDGHADRVWALEVNKSESHFTSGSGDSTIVIWKDVTEIEKEELMKKNEEEILKEQELSNLMQKKDYAKAIILTISLEQPYRTLTILKDILITPDGEVTLFSVFKQLQPLHIDSILRFAVTWNQNSKHCHEAQRVLSIALKIMTFEQLLALPNMKSNLEGLLPYTERHYQRMGRLLQQATFLEYTWRRMKISEENSFINR